MISGGAFEDLRHGARKRLPAFLFDYIEGGSYDEQTLIENRAALRQIRLRQRVLKDVSTVDTSWTLFGRRFALPVVLGPVGLAGLCSRRGEVAAALASKESGIAFCLSAVSVCDIEEVATSGIADFWFQLYMIRDRAFLADLLERASRRASALVLTVDMPMGATRYRDLRSGFSGKAGWIRQLRFAASALVRPRWLWDVGMRGRPHSLGNLQAALGQRSGLDDFARWIGENFDASVNWSDLEFIRENWSGPIILKGILDPEDAAQAVEIGVDGIVVSNHGGRQMDGTLPTATALPVIAEKVNGRTCVLVDGGVRSGIDVMRMLSLGADGVLLGRAWAYALTNGGAKGVRKMISTLGNELTAAMAMAGCCTLRDIGSDILADGVSAGSGRT